MRFSKNTTADQRWQRVHGRLRAQEILIADKHQQILDLRKLVREQRRRLRQYETAPVTFSSRTMASGSMLGPAPSGMPSWMYGMSPDTTTAIESGQSATCEIKAADGAGSAPQSDAERTVASIAAMLGWMNVPPRETLERDIAALKARAGAGSAPSDEIWDELLAELNESPIALTPDPQASPYWPISERVRNAIVARRSPRAHGSEGR